MKILDNFRHWYFMKFSKEKWALMQILKEPVTIEKKPADFYFRLYESNKGNRKVEFGCTDSRVADLGFIARQMSTYQQRIVRWKEGRFDPKFQDIMKPPKKMLQMP